MNEVPNMIARQKIEAKKSKGCKECGYKKCLRSLHLHHRMPYEKKFSISQIGNGQVRVSPEELEKELAKCDVLCANCHNELHDSWTKESQDFDEEAYGDGLTVFLSPPRPSRGRPRKITT